MMGVCLVTMVNSPEEVGITGIQTMAGSAKDDGWYKLCLIGLFMTFETVI
jgi:hypothetical protein